jgi:hypothetical protein
MSHAHIEFDAGGFASTKGAGEVLIILPSIISYPTQNCQFQVRVCFAVQRRWWTAFVVSWHMYVGADDLFDLRYFTTRVAYLYISVTVSVLSGNRSFDNFAPWTKCWSAEQCSQAASLQVNLSGKMRCSKVCSVNRMHVPSSECDYIRYFAAWD